MNQSSQARELKVKKRVISSSSKQESESEETDNRSLSLSLHLSGLKELEKNPSALKHMFDGKVSAQRPSFSPS